MAALIAGFLLSVSLIVAIGPQNAFVLRQGLRQHHVFWVCMICALSDALLISLGILGFGTLIKEFPAIESVARYGGALFLVVYGVKSLLSAFRVTHTLEPLEDLGGGLSQTVFNCMALTWLNPHVYLDTLVLMGSIATQYEGAARAQFGAGAIAASTLFFFGLGYGARFLAPIFHRPAAWRVLDSVIGIIMLAIATLLLLT